MKTGLLMALALFMGAATFNTAEAAAGSGSGCTSARTSVYGTITSVAGSTFMLNATDDTNGRHIRTTRADARLLVRATGARINSDGLAVHPGVFAGVFGCFSGRHNFNASEVTLATSLRTYPRSSGRIAPDREDRNTHSGEKQTIVGNVLSNGGRTNRVVIAMANGRQIAVFTSELRTARVGDRISATGYLNDNGNFRAASARDLSNP